MSLLEQREKRSLESECTADADGNKRFKPTALQQVAEKTTKRHVYNPINSEQGHVRLLTIKAGVFGSPLQVDLEKICQLPEFHSSKRPDKPSCGYRIPSFVPFDALSYAWGSPDNPEIIRVGRMAHVLSITRNLAIALPYLRLPDRDRMIWIDALCINQASLEERGDQVKLMPDIYRAAQRVVCWVGPPSTDSAVAFDAIRQLNVRLDVNLKDDMVQARAEEDKDWADTTIPLPFDSRVMRAISDLFGRAWFERLWIYQEARLGSDRAMLQCGHDAVEWQKVVQANWSFRFKPWKESVSPEFRRRMGIVDRMHFPNPTSLGLIIRRTSGLKCSDPRDRVYANRSTTRQEEQDMSIDVNYELPVGKVYQNYVERFMSHFQSLRLLPLCELQNHSLEMPTWVPDWSHPPSTNYPRAARYASGYMRANVINISKDTLNITGLHVATIAQRTVFDVVNATEANIRQFIRDSAPAGVLSDCYPGGTTMLEAFCSTLCFDVFRERTLPERVIFPSFKHSSDFVKTVLSEDIGTSDLSRDETDKYLRYIAEACKGRSVMTTVSGHLGLAPAICEPGDRIYAFPGCRDLIAVRRHSSKSGSRVVGHTYVHGMIDAEPLFGPLPRHYSAVMRCEEGVLRDLWFRNEITGVLEEEDPRFRDLDGNCLVDGLRGTGKAPKIEFLRTRDIALESVSLL